MLNEYTKLAILAIALLVMLFGNTNLLQAVAEEYKKVYHKELVFNKRLIIFIQIVSALITIALVPSVIRTFLPSGNNQPNDENDTFERTKRCFNRVLEGARTCEATSLVSCYTTYLSVNMPKKENTEYFEGLVAISSGCAQIHIVELAKTSPAIR